MSEQDSVRWYTRARRLPLFIGVMSDGTRIPGGPFTLVQAVGAMVSGYLAYLLIPLWARFGFLVNVAVFVGFVAGTVYLLGLIPADARNPLKLLAGLVNASTAPRHGAQGGRAVRVRRPRSLRHRIVVVDRTRGDVL